MKLPILSHHLARGKLTGMKCMKRRKEKTEEFQRGAWYFKRFDRG